MRRNWIDRCLASLQNSTVACKAVLVDNGSTDNTGDFVTTHYPDAVWLPQGCNLGFGKANNIGISYALERNADHVLLLNQDAAIHPEALALMLAENDGESLLSPLHLNGDGTCIDEMFRFSLRNANNHMNDDMLIRHALASHYVTGEICAACWLMPRRLLEKVGGFNPLFYHYGEDNNYYQRMVYHNVKTLLVPAAYMMHDRNTHGDPKMFKKNLVRRNLLLEVCDINHSATAIVKRLCRLLITCYSKYLPQRMYTPGTFLLECFRLLFLCPKIRSYRKTDKQEGKNWLI